MRKALIDLFRVLDQPEDERDPYLDEDLAAFPYVNGGLFSDEDIEIPPFTDEIRDLLLQHASEDFDWSSISPTIFGAVFESTLNPETRRSGGMHYTSIENIHKVIDPLFLDDLQAELAKIEDISVIKTRKNRLEKFQDKLASLTFLDPACGSGNFLTETYISLRRLENEVIRQRIAVDYNETTGQIQLIYSGDYSIKVSIGQFYGIEINDFAVTVAKTALWISEEQMLRETQEIIHSKIDFLPLKSYANIIQGNALVIDWESIVSKETLSYIMGNPPFVGARRMNKLQKNETISIFGKDWDGVGDLDYVCCWYKKAVDFIKTTAINVAFVSTNSISQGRSVSILFKPLIEEGLVINFAYQTFQWDSEAKIKAHVHCVIIGFSTFFNFQKKKLFIDNNVYKVDHINGYLLDGDDIYIESRNNPICNIPTAAMGNQPIDDGIYLFTEKEMQDFIQMEPSSSKWFRPWYGSKEFINQTPRYCLWLGNCPPYELRRMPLCLERVEAVQTYRKKSNRASTKKLAEYPTRFQTENMPKGHYICIPEVSSDTRRYIPMGYMNEDVLCSNKLRIIPNADLYHFGILESNVHMAWVRTVCGRLETRYDYSIKIVYNNFPWPSPSPEQKSKIEQTAQGILDARARYPDSSLADLYDPLTMPPELRKAHDRNNVAVMKAYGFPTSMSEADCVAALMKMYQELTSE